MVNVEKHRRKAIENDIADFINAIDGTNEHQLTKRKRRLNKTIIPYLNSHMNLSKQYRNEIRKNKI